MNKISLADNQPKFYRTSDFMANINAAIESEFMLLLEYIEKSRAEMRVSTATDMIEEWETSVALPRMGGLTIQQRRSRVLARRRQLSTTTVERIKAIISSYVGGTAEVIEKYAENTIPIEFIDIVGVPDNMNGLMEQLRCIVPAHLMLEYNYKWRTWRDVLNSGMTWGDIKNTGATWRDIKEGEVL